MSSLTGLNQVVPFSLTGLQNISGTINGGTPCDQITILGQTSFLSSSIVDANGNGNTTTRQLLFDFQYDQNNFEIVSSLFFASNAYDAALDVASAILAATPEDVVPGIGAFGLI